MKTGEGLSIIIRDVHEFNRVKDLLGAENLYFDFVPQMAEIETAIVVWSNIEDFSIGSTGSAAYQEKQGFRLVEFSDFFLKPLGKDTTNNLYTVDDMKKSFEYGKTLEPFDCFEDFIKSLQIRII